MLTEPKIVTNLEALREAQVCRLGMEPPRSCAPCLRLWLRVSQLGSRGRSQPQHHGHSGLDNSVCRTEGGVRGCSENCGVSISTPGLATPVAAGGPPPSAVTSSSVPRHPRRRWVHVTLGWCRRPKETLLLAVG